jgi:hypothetical protein
MPIDVGQVVAKKYELVRLLGRGSMGEVWSAHHQALHEQVAVKLLAWPSGEDAETPAAALARFRFEAQVAAKLSRKTRHIARVTDYGEDDGLPYLVMELLDGESLEAAIRTRGPLAPAEAAEIVSQIARALVQAHGDGVTHRDLKPANVFLTRDEDGRLLVKLLDFGIARRLHAPRLQGTFSTGKGFVFGTPSYMSPEQMRASPKLDHRCDLWALGTIAYEMLCQALPVDGTDEEEVMKNISAGRIVPLLQRDPRMPAAVGAFFGRAFADHVDDRFADAASLAQEFELVCGGSGVTVPPSTPSLADTSSGTTETEFSATVAGDALRMYRRQPTKVALAWAGAIAAVVVTVVGVRAAWRKAPPEVAPSDVIGAAVSPPDPIAHAIASTAWTPLAAAASTPMAPPVPPAAPPPASATQVPEKPAPPEATTRRASAGHSAAAIAPAQPSPATNTSVPRATHASPKPAEDRNDVF